MRKVIFMAVLLALMTGSQARAEQATLKLEIVPMECTVDTLSTGSSQLTTLQPEGCSGSSSAAKVAPQSGPASVPEEGGLQPARQAALLSTGTHDKTPGDQGVFEDTAAEPLAAWVGVGNERVPPAQPIAASVATVTITGALVDAAFFGLRFTQFLWTGLHKGTVSIIDFLLRVVFRM